MILSFFEQKTQDFTAIISRLKAEEDPKSRFQRKIERIIYFSQFAFVFGYTGLMLKLAFFNHYRKYNKILKFSIVFLYQITIDPMTIFAGYIAIMFRTHSVLNISNV